MMLKGFTLFIFIASALISVSFAAEILKDPVSGPQSSSTNQNKTSNLFLGKEIYNKTCVACHGVNGKGVAPSFPDFTQQGGVLSQPYNKLLHNVMHGIGSMPAKGGYPALTNKEIEASLHYIISNFSPGAAPKTEEVSTTELQQMKQQIIDLNKKVEKLEAIQAKEDKNYPVTTKVKNETPEINKSSDRNSQNTLVQSYFWPTPDISGLLTGGASAGFSTQNHQGGSFDILDFNPLLLVRYKDLVFMQSSLDFALDNDANTNVNLNTLNFNFFVNDFMIIGIGEYDSPMGYFVQNLSPGWINRLPTVPVGFDSNQAAPQSQVGIQVRGGFYLFSCLKMNYITFFANGPRAYADSTTGLIDYVSTDPFLKNYGHYVGGGRLGILPIPELEIGVSASAGKLALLDLSTNSPIDIGGRDYTSLGGDLSFKWSNWDFRAELIKQLLGANESSLFPQSASWKAWYLQLAYLFPFKLEPVVRWGGFTSADTSQSQHQLALGLDYWIAPSIAVQSAYEINKGQSGSSNSSNNVFLIQLVFGF